MKRLISVIIAAVIALLNLTVISAKDGPSRADRLTDPTGPEYRTSPVYDDDGLTDYLTYTFPSGVLDAERGQILFMANGEFLPYLSIMEDGQYLVPLRFAAEAFGGLVEWDADNRAAVVTLDSTATSITIGERLAQVSVGGVSEEQHLYNEAVIFNDRTYINAKAFGEIFGKADGFEPDGVIAYNPVVWIDEKTPAAKPDITALQTDCKKALTAFADNIKILRDGIFADWGETNDKALAEIKGKIDDMEYLRHIGRYALIEGPYTILLDDDGTIYFNTKGYLMWRIYKADFDDPEIFLEGYFLG